MPATGLCLEAGLLFWCAKGMLQPSPMCMCHNTQVSEPVAPCARPSAVSSNSSMHQPAITERAESTQFCASWVEQSYLATYVVPDCLPAAQDLATARQTPGMRGRCTSTSPAIWPVPLPTTPLSC